MNERFLEALKKLKKEQDEIELDLKAIKKDIEEKGTLNMQKALFTVADDLARYTIKDGNWYYNGKDTGIKAEGIDGKDGAQGIQGIPGKDGKDGKDGKPGKDGRPGKDGKNGLPGRDGKDGKNGKDGKDGKDGEAPVLKIGKVETSPEYGGALAKLRKGKDGIIYLDLTLPRGPQGFTGFDGKDAKINGTNTLNIIEGENISIEQNDDELIINATNSGNVDDVKVDGTSVVDENKIANIDLSDYAKKNINNNFSSNQTINGDLQVYGNITNTGESYETHAEQLYTKKDIIKTRDGAISGLGNNEVTGIEAIKYDGTNNGRLVFDNTGTARVGDVGDEVPLLGRDETANMTDDYVMVWDSTNLIAKTVFRMVTLTQAQYDALVSGGTVDSNTYYFIEEE